MWKFFKTFWVVRERPEIDWAVYVRIYALNFVLVSRRLEMGMEFGSIKRNQCRRSGLPMDNPLALFWDCKISPSLYEMDHKCPCVLELELFDVSGLSWLIIEINRLMLDVLT